MSWNWPGSRWWKLDLHSHSPASYDFGGPTDRSERNWTRWVESAQSADLDGIAITDHNSSGAIDGLQTAATSIPNSPVIFPGVEITASCGTHLLVIFDPSCNSQHVDDLLSRANISVDSRGTDLARSNLSVEQILRLDLGNALVIGAHINGPKGILELDGQQRLSILKNDKISGVEINPDLPLDQSYIDGSRPEIARSFSRIWCSDAHSFEDLGRRFTWVKMSRPDIEGLTLALYDGEDSLLPQASTDLFRKNVHADNTIEEIQVSLAKFMGRVNPIRLSFNPWLNSLVGGRGTGKSSIVDFARAALGRRDELSGALSSSYSHRMRVPPSRNDEGLLTSETRVEVVYQKDGDRFRLVWSPSLSSPQIYRIIDGADVAEEGDVTERFPVRIYSQKQLFELARTPNALLQVVDDSPDVRGNELARQRNEHETTYLSHLATARSYEAQAMGLASRRAVLSDVRRKIQLLEQGTHSAVLNQYRATIQANDAWIGYSQQVEDWISEVETLVGQFPTLDADGLPTDDGAATLRSVLNSQRQAISSFKSSIEASTSTVRREISESINSNDGAAWRLSVQQISDAYAAVVVELTAAGIANPQEYGDLVTRAGQIEEEIADLTAHQTSAAAASENARTRLESYRAARQELSARRGAFAQATSNDLVRLRVEDGVERGLLTDFLRGALGIDRFDDDYEHLARRISPEAGSPWTYARLDAVVSELRNFLSDENAALDVRDRRFATAIRRVAPERVDRIALYLPEDRLSVSFRDSRDPSSTWKELSMGSPGQQTAALLAFVLGYGSEPMILDQPEDDLDSTLIYELVVKRLRETKQKRQLIVVTHNPNIVVHGDAELVISLSVRAGQTAIECFGGLQEMGVRNEICRVLEGGPEAFKARYRRIMHSG
ncbi:TrlF family AAA-like ATPase [Pseudoxanthomonas sp. LARHCG66]